MDKKTVLAELVACLHGIEHDQKRLAETGCVMTTNAQTRKRIKAIEGAIEYIKAQEAVEPKKVNRYIDFDGEGHPYTPETYDCGACGKELPWKANYCHDCGRAVKWE